MPVKLITLVLVPALLAACGIKGSLYLPPPPTSGPEAPEGDHSKPFEPPELAPRPPIE